MSESRASGVRTAVSIQGLFLLFGVAIAAFFPFFTAFLRSRGVTPEQTGVVIAGMAFARVVGNPVWGSLADTRLGRTRTLQIGTVLSALAAVGMWAVGDGFLGIAVASVIFAGMGGSLGPNLDAIAISHLGEGNMQAYGRIRGWESFTYALACLGCGLLFQAVGLDLNMLIYAAVCLVVLAWSVTLRVPTVLHEGEHGRMGAVGTVLRDSPRFRSFLSATLLLWFGFSAAWNFIPLKILDEGGGPLLIGLGAGLGGLIEVPMMRSSSNLSERFGIRAVFMAGCLVYALGFLLWGVVDDPQVLSFLTFLEGIAFALVFTMSVVIVGKLVTPTLYSTGQAVAATVGFGVAPILGGLVGGWVYGALGPAVLYGGASLVALVAGGIAYRALDDPALTRPQATPELGAPPLGDLEPDPVIERGNTASP
ncbi:MAG: MFS transporter [Actinomycetota bacterium]